MEKGNLEMVLEDINGKFDPLLEGHEGLRGEIREVGRKTDERFGLVDFKIDTLNKKIDGVVAELKAHRADTEAHHGVYQARRLSDLTGRSERLDVQVQIYGNLRANSMAICRKLT
jgi:hypothetical protein